MSIRILVELYGVWKENIVARKFFAQNDSELRFSFLPLDMRYVRVGRGCMIERGARIMCFPEFGKHQLKPDFILENGVTIGPRLTALVADKLVIKRNAILAENVSLVTENHGMNASAETPYAWQELTTGPIVIGEGCWIGQNVTVLANVEIGDRCIIAAGAVVTKSIPSRSIAAGVPAKVIKRWDDAIQNWISV